MLPPHRIQFRVTERTLKAFLNTYNRRNRRKTMKKIGFIGVGIMGKSMVKNLMKAGFELHIYARTKSKVNDVIEEGAIFHETIGECVRASEAVITMVGFPQDVEEVYFDEGNIMDQAEKGMYRGPEVIQEQRQEHFLFWSVATRKIMRLVCRYLKLWERISIIREKLDVDSMPRW